MIDFKYRPDVDGLRAVAVTMVILFHAGLGFTGGFIGVDVFFVISGFLITGLILKEQDAGKFSLANFWVRRIRRIIPAATVMVVAVLIAGFFLLLPSDYEDLGKSTIAQQLMLSNVYFWQNTGYFDGPSDLKPLLHTWSLAVEEQFYLGYPFLLMFLYRFGRKATFATLITLCLGSLAVSEYGVHHHPSATFFLLPTRAWELLIGGLIFFLPRPSKMPAWALSGASWLSLAAILGAGWFYTDTTPFPGLAATVPCVATAVLIYSNTIRLSLPAALLATKPLVFVGLISYSLYLWHWPIFAFGRYWLGVEISTFTATLAVGLTFVIATVAWFCVETPLRRTSKTTLRWKIPVATWLFTGATVASVSCVVLSASGFPNRLPKDIAQILEKPTLGIAVGRSVSQWESRNFPAVGGGEDSKKFDFIVWGDSHAGSISDLINDLAVEYQVPGIIASQPATAPLPDVFNKFSPRDDQIKRSSAIMSLLSDANVKHVILVANWQLYDVDRGTFSLNLVDASGKVKEGGRLVVTSQLRKLCWRLEQLGVSVWIMKRVPNQPLDPTRKVAASLLLRDVVPRGLSLNDYLSADLELNAKLDRIGQDFDNVSVLDPAPFCLDKNGFSLIGDRTGSFYVDNGHISSHGARMLLRPLLEPVFREINRH